MKKFLIAIAAVGALMCGAAGLSACANTTEYSVACQTCENGRVIVADNNVKAGQKVILAAHPNAGYKLTSFLLDGEVLEGCSFVMPEKDVTVSADFELITYSINYVLGDAVLTENNPDTYTIGSETQLHAPQKEGYEICGWYRYCVPTEYDWNMEDYRVTSLEGLYGDLTLYAKYYNPPHEISVADSANGWCYIQNYNYEAYYGEKYNVEVEPDTGYEFDYLAVNGERVEGTSFIMPAGGAEITAVFKPVVYEINYVLFGGKNAKGNPTSFTVEDGYIHLKNATKSGYMFIGWYTDEAMTQPVYGDLNVYDYIDSPLTLYAYFERY
ncbi:MAG: InlB B-repeat-containing protein [Clostridia bacterium]|nr:InlB B-repeat-containing protein [Clostridia bacterium]